MRSLWLIALLALPASAQVGEFEANGELPYFLKQHGLKVVPGKVNGQPARRLIFQYKTWVVASLPPVSGYDAAAKACGDFAPSGAWEVPQLPDADLLHAIGLSKVVHAGPYWLAVHWAQDVDMNTYDLRGSAKAYVAAGDYPGVRKTFMDLSTLLKKSETALASKKSTPVEAEQLRTMKAELDAGLPVHCLKK